MKKHLVILFTLGMVFTALGQSNYRLIQQGNRDFNKNEFSESEIAYRKALEKDGKLTTAQYNVGNSRYAQEDFEGAAEKFSLSAEAYTTKQDKADAYHNLGNSLLSQKKYEESIEAYKNSLKLVPSDMDTKYNLAYAQQMLKKEQEQEQQNQENQDQQQDQKEDQQDKGDQNKEDQQDQKDKGDQEKDDKKEGDLKDDKGKNDEDKKGDQEKPSPPKEAKLSKEQADQILKMLEGEEAKLQDKLDEPEGEAVKIKIEKDW